jgi:hypothetical protein
VFTGKNLVFPVTSKTLLILRVEGNCTGCLSSARISKIVCLEPSSSWNIQKTCHFPRGIFVDSLLFSKSTTIISYNRFFFVIEAELLLSELEIDLNFIIQRCKLRTSEKILYFKVFLSKFYVHYYFIP